eukprot:jgi/Botrbrau1/16283/Bobra.0066s0060.1
MDKGENRQKFKTTMFWIFLLAGQYIAQAQQQTAPYGPNGRVIQNTATDVSTLANVWNTSWQELIRILDESTSNHTARRHWIECSPTTIDFTKGDLVESGKALAPAIRGFAFRNFSGSSAKRSAIASVSKADTADQLIASITVDGLAPPQYFNLTSLSYASTAPIRLIGHKTDGTQIKGDPTTGSVLALDVPEKWRSLWQLDFAAAEPSESSIGISLGKLEGQLCTFRWGENETYGTPPLQQTLRNIGVLPSTMPPLPDMDPYTRNAVREQARAVATASSVIPNAITTQVGQLGASVAQAASTLEPGLPVPQIPNAPVPEIVQVASNGINTAIKAAVTGNGAILPQRELPFPIPTMTPAVSNSPAVVSGSTAATVALSAPKKSAPAPAPAAAVSASVPKPAAMPAAALLPEADDDEAEAESDAGEEDASDERPKQATAPVTAPVAKAAMASEKTAKVAPTPMAALVEESQDEEEESPKASASVAEGEAADAEAPKEEAKSPVAEAEASDDDDILL